MAAEPDEFAYDIGMSRAAADLWQARSAARETKQRHYDAGEYDQADTTSRLVKRANRLISKVRLTAAADTSHMSRELATMVERGPITVDEFDNALYERVIGKTRDFLAIDFLETGLLVNRSVGRVVRNLGGGHVSYGSGFMVAPGLLLTNWHVLENATWAAGARVEFDYQRGRAGTVVVSRAFALDPKAFFLNDKRLDFALVGVAPAGAGGAALATYGWCPLFGEEGKAVVGDSVNIIQHPKGEMKQVVVRESRVFDLPDQSGLPDWHMHYGGDTERGSSGSPVFNDQWEVVALHHAGVPRRKGKQVLDVDGNPWSNGDDPDRIDWVANEGIRVSRLVAFIADAKVRPHEEKLRDQFLAAEPPPDVPTTSTSKPLQDRPLDPGNQMEAPKNPQPEIVNTNIGAGTVTLTIPLTVTVSLGTPATWGGGGTTSRQTGGGGGGGADDATGDALPFPERLDTDYDNRPGYDADFLGFNVPLPSLGKAIRDQALDVDESFSEGDPRRYELKYHHFSVIMHVPRRLAIVSVVNYDPDAPFHVAREGEGSWRRDPRVEALSRGLEADNRYYSGEQNPLDRGHLARRADAAWGASQDEADMANTDTFHWTNCAPQHEIYNQSGLATKANLLLWGNIENHIAAEAGRNERRVTVFNGPIFAGKDPFVPAARKPADRLQVPRAFWKLVVMQKSNGNPGAYAFLLGQEAQVDYLADEDFDDGPFHIYQLKVKELESRTKLDFGDLRTFDPLENPAADESFGDGTEAIAIGAVTDVRL